MRTKQSKVLSVTGKFLVTRMIAVLALFCSLEGFAQTGPTNVLAGTTKSYAPAANQVATDGVWRITDNLGTPITSGATLSNDTNTGTDVDWDDTGTYLLQYGTEIDVGGLGNLNFFARYTWTVTVFEIDEPSITVDNQCGQTVLEHDGNQTDVTFYWKVPGSANYNVATNPLTVTDAGTYYVRGEHTDGTGTAASTTVTINPGPVTTGVSVSDRSFCSSAAVQGAEITILNSNANDHYYLFKSDGSPVTDVAGQITSVSFGVQPEGSYYVEVGNDDCANVSLDSEVTITKVSDAVSHSITTNEAPSTSYCTGTVTFEAVGATNNSSYQWKVNGVVEGTGATFTPDASHAGASQDISVTYDVEGPCSGQPIEGTAIWENIELTAPVVPNVDIIPGTGSTVCKGDAIDFEFEVTNATNYTYSWNTGETTEEITRNINASGTKTRITITVTDGCVTKTSDYDEVTHDIRPDPDLTVTVIDATYCSLESGGRIQIESPNAADIYYLYDSDDAFVQEKNGDDVNALGNVAFSRQPEGTYTIKAANANCTHLKSNVTTSALITKRNATTWYFDGDGDGYHSDTELACDSPGTNWSESSDGVDCNDDPATGFAYNPETVWYQDADGDDYYGATATQCNSPAGTGWSITAPVNGGGDCNDDPATGFNYNPATVWYQDADGDDYYGATETQCETPAGGGWSITAPANGGGDCNDDAATGFPYNPATTWYQDIDGDTYYGDTRVQCASPGSSWNITSDTGVDCDDTSPDLIENCIQSANILGSDGKEVKGTTTNLTVDNVVQVGYWTLSSGGTMTFDNASADITWTSGSGTVTVRYGFDITRYVNGTPTTEFFELDNLDINLYDLPAPTLTQSSVCDDATVSHDGDLANVTYYWQNSATGENMSNSENPREFLEGGVRYVRPYHSDGVWGIAGQITVVENPSPGPVQLIESTKFISSGTSTSFQVRNPDPALTYTWYDLDGAVVATGNTFTTPTLTSDATYTVEASSTSGCISPSRTSCNVYLEDLSGMNWIQSIGFSSTGKVSDKREYFDLHGKSIQSQAKMLADNNMMVIEKVFDQLNRPATQSLPAPTGANSFGFDTEFLSETATEGNLRWYYSNSNSWEPKVDVTTSPFLITEFYEDGTGDEKSFVGPLEYANPDMKTYSRNFPVMEELDNHYLAIRDLLLGYTSNSMKNEAIKIVGRDADGKEGISFIDPNGQLLASAYGYLSADDNGIAWNLSFDYDAASGISPELYFHVPEGSTLTAPAVGVTDMITGSDVSGTTLNQGFYQYSDPSSFSYNYTYYNASFHFYDDMGRLLLSVPPMGVKDILSRTVGSIDQAYVDDIPFAKYYKYDFQGNLIETNEPDIGITKYMHRKDGLVRFSQNSLQRERGTFSYTNYDVKGRPVESGEYVGSTFIYGSSELKGVLEETGVNGGIIVEPSDHKDWIRTNYDLPDSDPTAIETSGTEIALSGPVEPGLGILKAPLKVTLKPGFVHNAATSGKLSIVVENQTPTMLNSADFEFEQNFTFGAVSYTESPNTKTWYSYDEQGQVTEMRTWYKYLMDAPKTIQYEINFLGNLAKIRYQPGAADEFYHAYDYDQDDRIIAAYASTSEADVDNRSNSALQMSYDYYLHGPLKRAELADDLQGIDYVYNIMGQLKAINDPDNLADETGFMQDAFAQRYEYFSGDYMRSGVLPTSSVANETYSGNIAKLAWNNVNPAGTQKRGEFQFDYDNRYYLKEAVYNDYGTTFDPGNLKFRVDDLTYDPNGNISSINRYNQQSSLLHQFDSYDYKLDTDQSEGSLTYNTNQLDEISGYASWTYNAIGQMTEQRLLDGSGTEIKYVYNATGKVVEILDENLDVIISYEYDDRGFRIRSIDHIANTETLYIRDPRGKIMAIYDNASGYEVKEMPIYAQDRVGTYYASSGDSHYELKDHLGNVRNLVSRLNRDRVYYSDYYPFGLVMRSDGQSGRYGYQGEFSEYDDATGLNYFEARLYDAITGRWQIPDPMRQFHSPYLAMANNPVLAIDPDGRIVPVIVGYVLRWFAKEWAKKLAVRVVWGVAKNVALSKKFTWEQVGIAFSKLDALDLAVDAAKDVFDAKYGKKLKGAVPIIADIFTELVKSKYGITYEKGVTSEEDYKKVLLDATKGYLSGLVGKLSEALGGEETAAWIDEKWINKHFGPKLVDIAFDFIHKHTEKVLFDEPAPKEKQPTRTEGCGCKFR